MHFKKPVRVTSCRPLKLLYKFIKDIGLDLVLASYLYAYATTRRSSNNILIFKYDNFNLFLFKKLFHVNYFLSLCTNNLISYFQNTMFVRKNQAHFLLSDLGFCSITHLS